VGIGKVLLSFSGKQGFCLENTTITLGRGSFLNLQDKRVSRTQVVITRSFSSLSATRKGKNPSYLLRKGEEDFELPLDQQTLVQDGDQVCLLLKEYPVTVQIKEVKRSREQSGIPTKTSSAKRKKMASLSDSEELSNSSELIESHQEKKLTDSHANFSIAFPSLSTSTFQFDLSKAAQIATEEIHSFLRSNSDTRLRIYLVDLTQSPTIEEFQQKRNELSVNDDRYEIIVGDITKLRTQLGITANCIVNAGNSTLSDKGGGINAAIHKAAGSELLQETKRIVKSSKVQVSRPYPVSLSANSPLRVNQGIEHIIQVCGPNMNPSRANYLDGDYQKGSQLLRKAYRSILECFSGYFQQFIEHAQPVSSTRLEQLDSEESHSVPTAKPKVSAVPKSTPTTFGWKDKLLEYVYNPDSEGVYYHDDQVVIIYDKFPKAKVHLLVIPKQIIKSISVLNSSHIPLLNQMKSHANRIIAELDPQSKRKFRVGFHAIPSMNQVHMHVISQDFDSPCLKNKTHWQSFTTEFFIDAEEFIEKLTEHGSTFFIDQNYYENILKGDLKCPKCQTKLATIPKAKQHTASCMK